MLKSMPTERRTPQARVNTRALEIVAELKGDLAGHKDMDILQFAHVNGRLDEINGKIDGLKSDAKDEMGALSQRQEGYHKDNTAATSKVITEVGIIAASLAAMQSKTEGERGIVRFVLKNLPTVFTAALFGLTIWWHK